MNKNLVIDDVEPAINNDKKTASLSPNASDSSADALKVMKQRMEDQQRDDAILGEWKAIGFVIDRIFFWICLIPVLIVTPYILGNHDDNH